MEKDLLKVAIRQNAIVVPHEWIIKDKEIDIDEITVMFAANCSELGFTFSEDLLKTVNRISPKHKLEIFQLLKDITGVNKNWTPLVKQWNMPTGESVADHVITWFANIFKSENGTKLPCGHIIPNNTFPLERYNGCPFCGSQFEFDKLNYEPKENKLKILRLFTTEDMYQYLISLLESPVALDATQTDDIKMLISEYGLPENIEIGIKETLMLVIDTFVESNRGEEAGRLFKTPNDILRYLWYKHTGFLQIVEPKTIANRLTNNIINNNLCADKDIEAKIKSLKDLKLKYSRTESKIYALWLNNLTMDISAQCENMHPKRGMWVRFIRALRLAEYSKKAEFGRLANLLDTFYNEDYEVWQGEVNYYKLKADAESTFALLKQRPGLFARSLFSTMLWFGPDISVKHFREIMNQVPARLILTLNMYAEIYFDKSASRTVKPLGGISKRIPPNNWLQLYSDEELERMQLLIRELSLDVIKNNLKRADITSKTICIDSELYNVPIAIGDRSEHIQDLSGALMGTRFKVEGDSVRLFMQWGEGLPAQHLDMDLSCMVAYKNREQYCSYSQLVITGCKHSGDIQRIPNKKGTAEYIDIDLTELKKLGAKYVSFTCNAYTSGSLAPNLVVGWMNSKYPMKVTASGVAYNPVNVQHQVRIKQSLTKGMVFGVLDIDKSEIIWLEMNFGGQVVQNLNIDTVELLMNKLDAKLKIGDLLQLKAEVQGLKIVDDAENADEVYNKEWAMNTAEVCKLFL
jgi:hypothetical protein